MTKNILGLLSITMLLSVAAPAHAVTTDVAYNALNGNANALDMALIDESANTVDSRENNPLHLAVYGLGQSAQAFEQARINAQQTCKDNTYPMVGGALGALTMTGVLPWIADKIINSAAGSDLNVAATYVPISSTVGGAIIGATAGSAAGSLVKHVNLDIEKLEQRALPMAAIGVLLAAANYGNDNGILDLSARSTATLFAMTAGCLLVVPDLIGQIVKKAALIVRDTTIAGTGIESASASVKLLHAYMNFKAHVDTVMLLANESTVDSTAKNAEGLTASELAYNIAASTQDVSLQRELLAVAHALSA